MGQPYAGDLTSQEAWRALQEDDKAVLVDVRTRPEWGFVGLPDLSSLGQRPHCVEWQTYPEMAIDPGFTSAVETAEVGKDATAEGRGTIGEIQDAQTGQGVAHEGPEDLTPYVRMG